MTKAARQTKNKAAREAARGKELTEAKKQIKILKREVTRLRKLVEKLGDSLIEESPEESPTPVAPRAAPEKNSDKCCNNPDPIRLGPMLICRSCKTKQKVSQKESNED